MRPLLSMEVIGPPESPWQEKEEYMYNIEKHKVMTCIWMWKKQKIFHFTWQASMPPLNTPAQIMRGVIPSSISLLHTVLLIMRTSAFCNTDATSSRAGRRHFISLLTILGSYYIIICTQLHSVSVVSTFPHYLVWTNRATLPVLESFTRFVLEFRHTWLNLCFSV